MIGARILAEDVAKRIKEYLPHFLSDRIYEYDKDRCRIRQVPEFMERGRGMER